MALFTLGAKRFTGFLCNGVGLKVCVNKLPLINARVKKRLELSAIKNKLS
jgi:hypothetical protein